MIATVRQIQQCTCKPLDLPNWIGRKWIAKVPFCTVVREGATWRYGFLVDLGAVLEFAGWAGTDRGEPFASFVTPDKPGCVVFLREKDLARWCVEIPASVVASVGEVVGEQPVKVRIVDDCDSGEGK
jgi:hypothetical protein